MTTHSLLEMDIFVYTSLESTWLLAWGSSRGFVETRMQNRKFQLQLQKRMFVQLQLQKKTFVP
jgi:hypothetical protein